MLEKCEASKKELGVKRTLANVDCVTVFPLKILNSRRRAVF